MNSSTPPNLTVARLNAGHSIRSLAAALDVPEQSIRRLESGDGVHPANAKKVADWLGCTVTELLPLEKDVA